MDPNRCDGDLRPVSRGRLNYQSEFLHRWLAVKGQAHSICVSMSLRLPFSLCLFAILATLARAESLPAVDYTLRFPDAVHHYVEVEASLPTGGAAELEVFMPVWTPGSYLLREYSRNIDRIDATDANGQSLPLQKIAKNRWQVTTGGHDRVTLRYRVYGWEINVRSNWIEGSFAMLNGAPTYVTVADHYQRPYHVRVELPKGWAGTYTALPAGDQPNTYTAPDFDTLIDSPLLAGSPQVDHFEVDGVRHFLVTLGGAGVWDNARAARNLKHLVQTERDFWGQLPYQHPYYFFNLLTGSRGGLEHKRGLVMTADRWLSRSRAGITSWLSLASHEYFHAWNGKRLRPVELGPFPYEHEAYTHTLWVVEGVTSYYQQIMLRRAGFYTQQDYLNTLSGLIASVQNTPGRLVQSLSASSFDAWIKAYRPDVNSLNTRFSYYNGGALAAALLDAKIRQVTNGAKSLDDVMRAAFARYSGEHGYTESDFIGVLNTVTGTDLTPWYDHNIKHAVQFDYQPMLDWYGLRFMPPEKPAKEMLPNGLEPPDQPRGWLGLETQVKNGRVFVATVLAGTPAYDAGLYPGDELVGINGFRVEHDPASLTQTYHPGDQVELLISRRDQLLTLPATLGVKPEATWRLEVRSDATPEQKAHLEAWAGAGQALSATK